MPTNRCRPFTMLDGMILVVAIALGLAYLRAQIHQLDPSFDWSTFDWSKFLKEFERPHQGWTAWGILDVWYALWILGGPTVMACTVGLLFLRLRQPWTQGLRRRHHRPGTIALLWAVTSFVAAIPASLGIFFVAYGMELSYLPLAMLWTFPAVGPALAGLCISVVWITLGMSKLWYPERSWLDRSGCLLGVFYIVNGPIVFTCFIRVMVVG